MQGNSDGLSPGLKPFLGVGHNRALPAPFGFDNGFQGDGIDDHFRVTRFKNGILPRNITVEWWINPSFSGTPNFCILEIKDTANKYVFSINNRDGGSHIVRDNSNPYQTAFSISSVVLIPNINNHIVITLSESGLATLFKNGVKIQTISIADYGEPDLIMDVFRLFVADDNGDRYNPSKIDEFRIYNKILPFQEVYLNYNSGIGNNPATTESLLLWYKFQEFEMLDFSPDQDNSDIRLGIRDHSGKNNHALPFNMDTDPGSPTYVLKPF